MSKENELEGLPSWLVLIFITVLGGWLRVLLLGTKGLWLDETFSVWIANHNIPDMLHWIISIDQHPPLYYLLLHYWIAHYGDTPYYVRLLSALVGTATIPVIYLIGKRISGDVLGLVAALFLALSPFNLYFGQEARMYTLLTFNAAVAIYALVILLTNSRAASPMGRDFQEYVRVWRTAAPIEPDTKREFSYRDETLNQTGWRAWIYRHRWLPIQCIETDLAWIALIMFSAATLLSHNTAVFFLFAINVFVVCLMLFQRLNKSGALPAFQAPSLGNWVKAQIGIVILWCPWLLVFIQQARKVDQQFWIPKPTWDIIVQSLRALLNASAQGQISQIMTAMLCAVLCLGLVYYRKKLSIFFFLAALFALPVLGELIVSMRRPIFSDRTLIWITIPLILLLAAGIAQIRIRFLMTVVLGIAAVNYLFSDGDILRFVQKEDWSTPAGYVANFAKKDDLVLFNSNFVVIPFNYYFKQYEDLYSIQVEKQGLPLDLFNNRILEPKMTTQDIPRLISLLHGHNRVWLVYSHNDYTDPMGLIPQTLASQMKLTRTREFYGGQVQLYETP